MSSTSGNENSIELVLNKEVDMMRAFAQLLENEQAILVNNQIDQLETITPDKNRLLNEIFSLEKQRNQILIAQGYSGDLGGMTGFLSAHAEAKHVAASWNTLIEVSTKAQENNRTNGLLISRQMNKNQSALNILQHNNQAVSTYGSDGQSKLNTTSGRGIIAR
jgi:flagellar biosynthesis/type III secretory pathway chaperone